jgi:hypothetical protein
MADWFRPKLRYPAKVVILFAVSGIPDGVFARVRARGLPCG